MVKDQSSKNGVELSTNFCITLSTTRIFLRQRDARDSDAVASRVMRATQVHVHAGSTMYRLTRPLNVHRLIPVTTFHPISRWPQTKDLGEEDPQCTQDPHRWLRICPWLR